MTTLPQVGAFATARDLQLRLVLRVGFVALLAIGLRMRAAPAASSAPVGAQGGSFKFVVVGDTQAASGGGAINAPVVAGLIADMNALQPDFANGSTWESSRRLSLLSTNLLVKGVSLRRSTRNSRSAPVVVLESHTSFA